jgi:hypothetical protein
LILSLKHHPAAGLAHRKKARAKAPALLSLPLNLRPTQTLQPAISKKS